MQPKAVRRHSNTENGKSRPNARPAMTRPKSSGDTHTLALYDGAADVEPMPLPSPTKGILMTPGTAAARRKTVSFGAHVQDNEGKRQGKSGLPDSCPGKFPSPFVKSTEVEDGNVQTAENTRGRNKLTEKLEQAREDSVKRKSVSIRQSIEPVKETYADSAPDVAERVPERFRIMFEQYRERSERECRKLVLKQRATKSFAREKDTQMMEAADQLRQEKKKVDRLERQVADLQAQLRDYHEKLRVSQAEEQNIKEEVNRLKRSSGLSGYRRHDESSAANSSRALDPEKLAPETTSKTRTSRERLSIRDTKTTTFGEAEKAPTRTRARHRNQAQPKGEQDDVWAPSLATPSLIPANVDNVKPAAFPEGGRTSTIMAPLKSLNINTLPQQSISVAMSMGMQPPSPQRDTRSDSPMRSPVRGRPKPVQSLSISVPDSSPFFPDAENERPNVLTGTPVPVRSPMRAVASNENGSPTPKALRRRNRENVAPRSPVQGSATESSEREEAERMARSILAADGRKVSGGEGG